MYFCALCCKRLAEFRRPQTAEEGQIVFAGGMYVGKHTSQATSVRAKASARSGLYPLEKMLAFLRSVSKFFDTLGRPGDRMVSGPSFGVWTGGRGAEFAFRTKKGVFYLANWAAVGYTESNGSKYRSKDR